MLNNVSLNKIGVIDELYDTVDLRIQSSNIWRTVAQLVTYNYEESYLLLQYFDVDRFGLGVVVSQDDNIPMTLRDVGVPATVWREAEDYPPHPEEEEEPEYDEDEDEYEEDEDDRY